MPARRSYRTFSRRSRWTAAVARSATCRSSPGPLPGDDRRDPGPRGPGSRTPGPRAAGPGAGRGRRTPGAGGPPGRPAAPARRGRRPRSPGGPAGRRHPPGGGARSRSCPGRWGPARCRPPRERPARWTRRRPPWTSRACRRRRAARAAPRGSPPTSRRPAGRRRPLIPLPRPISAGRSSHGSPVVRTSGMPARAWRWVIGGRPPSGDGARFGSRGSMIAQRAAGRSPAAAVPPRESPPDSDPAGPPARVC